MKARPKQINVAAAMALLIAAFNAKIGHGFSIDPKQASTRRRSRQRNVSPAALLVERHALPSRRNHRIWRLQTQSGNFDLAETHNPATIGVPLAIENVSTESEKSVASSRCDDDTTTGDGDRSTAVRGTSKGMIVTKMYPVPLQGFREDDSSSDIDCAPDGTHSRHPSISSIFASEDRSRLQLRSRNVTLPAALMLLDPETYPTQSSARKSIRKRSITIHRRHRNNVTADDTAGDAPSFTADVNFEEMGKVIARIYPGDIIGFQRRMGSNYYSKEGATFRPPPFDVPVIYEDEHMAIVNKPAGVVTYRAEGRRGHGRDTLLSALPYVLTPRDDTEVNATGEYSDETTLERPQPVHRLDRPTSGLVVVAKTKPAVVHLSQQFEFRRARKSYVAIVNGTPRKTPECNGDDNPKLVDESLSTEWNVIDYDLEGKSSITEWRIIRSIQSLHGKGGRLTLVELKPKTGRYHQLRRHMAWVCGSPLVGDTMYDGADEGAMRLRKRGLFLCSNEIVIDHPYYNTPSGQKEWAQRSGGAGSIQINSHAVLEQDDGSDRVVVRASIHRPAKFDAFLKHEDARAIKFNDES